MCHNTKRETNSQTLSLNLAGGGTVWIKVDRREDITGDRTWTTDRWSVIRWGQGFLLCINGCVCVRERHWFGLEVGVGNWPNIVVVFPGNQAVNLSKKILHPWLESKENKATEGIDLAHTTCPIMPTKRKPVKDNTGQKIWLICLKQPFLLLFN